MRLSATLYNLLDRLPRVFTKGKELESRDNRDIAHHHTFSDDSTLCTLTQATNGFLSSANGLGRLRTVSSSALVTSIATTQSSVGPFSSSVAHLDEFTRYVRDIDYDLVWQNHTSDVCTQSVRDQSGGSCRDFTAAEPPERLQSGGSNGC